MKKSLVSLFVVFGLVSIFGRGVNADSPTNVRATLQLLIDAQKRNHDVAENSTPPSFDFHFGPRPSPTVHSDRLDAPVSGFERVNVWNGIGYISDVADPNVIVELSDLHCAAFIGTRWEYLNSNLPVHGHVYPDPINGVFQGQNHSVEDVIRQRNGTTFNGLTNPQIDAIAFAYGGVKFGGWNNITHNNHGFTNRNGIDITGKTVRAYIAWGFARQVKRNSALPATLTTSYYQYGIGGDRFDVGDGMGRAAIAIGRRARVTNSWKMFVAHNMSEDTIRSRYTAKSFPSQMPVDNR
jgi:hypothetical protein